MKIEIKLLIDYINKVSMNGTVLMLDLRFTEEGLRTAIKNQSQTAMAIGFLPKDSFIEYEAIGDLYIKNSVMFMTLLKSFSDEVNISKVGESMIKIHNSNRKAFMVLADEKICDSLLQDKKPEIEYETCFKIDKKVLMQTLADMKTLDVPHIKFVKKDNNVSIEIGKSKVYDFISNDNVGKEIEDLGETKDVEVGVGGGFEDVVRCLGSYPVFKIASDKPLTFIDNDDFMEVEFMVAPFIEQEE